MLENRYLWLSVVFCLVLTLGTSDGSFASHQGKQFMKIRVIDAHTGRGVPLAQIRTQHASGVSFFTDSRGVAAIHVPGLMGEKAPHLDVNSFGYHHNQQPVVMEYGESKTFELRRRFDVQIAKRLYRFTGAGIYRGSWIFQENIPIQNPLINADILTHGQATSAVFRDKLFWFFGPEGASKDGEVRQRVSGATSLLPGMGGLDQQVGVALDYFEDGSGSSRDVLSGAQGETVTPKSLMVPATDPPQLFGQFEFKKGSSTREGIVKWDETNRKFRVIDRFPEDMRVKLCANVTRVRTDGREWFYFSCPLPLVRVPATPQALQDHTRYQTFTPVEFKASWEGKQTKLSDDREWEWKAQTATLDHPREVKLRRPFYFGSRQGLHHLFDLQAAEPFVARHGTVFWNEFRKKWILIANELNRNGPAQGNVYYAEADSPIGPWVYARKVFTHRNRLNPPYRGPFSLLNVKQHPYFTQDDGRTVFFSGLFKRTTSDQAVPRYNQNHLMYRLDLTENRLNLPTAVYLDGNFNSGFTYGTARRFSDDQQESGFVLFYSYPPGRHDVSANSPMFNHLDQQSNATPVPVWEETRQVNGGSASGLTTQKSPDVTSDTPVFYVWPSDFALDHKKLTKLLEFQHPTNSVLVYVPERFASFLRNNGWDFGGVIGQVWKSPRIDPPTNPSARPVRNCLGSSAVCDK